MILNYSNWLFLEFYEYELYERDLREVCIEIIKDETGITTEEAILVFENILKPNDLVINFAESHKEYLMEYFKQRAYEQYKEDFDVEE